ncbi:MAG: hypothetical protein IPL60_17255 [Ardenticatenia bacterium]|nr:hypothetical protein [Ardenticatenia bacterium]
MPSSPCPYPPAFVDDQRRRLLVARDRLRVQLEVAVGSSAGLPDASRPAPSWSIPVDHDTDRERARAGLSFALPPAALSAGLAASAAAALTAVDAALDRLAAGCYGWDGAAGAWIPADRLRALPGAFHSLPTSMEFV